MVAAVADCLLERESIEPRLDAINIPALVLHGTERFAAALEEKALLARYFRARALELGFEVGPEPDLSVVLFRWSAGDATATNQRILDAVLADGRVFLSSTTIDGVFWIRVAVLCFRTHRDRVDHLLEVLAGAIASEAVRAG